MFSKFKLNKFILLLFHTTLFSLHAQASGGGSAEFKSSGKYHFPEKTVQSIYTPLVEYLKEDYQPLAMPVCNVHEKMKVQLDLWLYQLFDLEEVSQMLTIGAWLEMSWKDCGLTWNPANFSNIQQLVLPADQIWYPDIINYESLHGNFEEGMFLFGASRARIRHDGMVQLGTQALLKSFCRFHLEDFPFDTQVCNLTFTSWNKDSSVFEMTSRDVDEQMGKESNRSKVDPADRQPSYNPSERMGHTFELAGNGEWQVLGLPSFNLRGRYRVGSDEKEEREYTEVRYQIILQRKPTYVKVYLVFPCLILIWVAAATFLLPVECGEKIGLSITVMLSLIVFLLLVADNIPRSSEGVPILGVFYLLSIFLVFLCVLMTTVVLNLGLKSTSIGMPRFLHRLLRHKIGHFLCFRYSDVHESHKWMSVHFTKSSKQNKKRGSVNANQRGGSLANFSATGQQQEECALTNSRENESPVDAHGCYNNTNSVNKEPPSSCTRCERNDWRFLALLLDRIFFVIYVLLATLLTLYISLQNSKSVIHKHQLS